MKTEPKPKPKPKAEGVVLRCGDDAVFKVDAQTAERFSRKFGPDVLFLALPLAATGLSLDDAVREVASIFGRVAI